MSTEQKNPSRLLFSRRQILNTAWGIALVALLGESAGIIYKYFQPANTGEFGSVIHVGSVGSFTPGSITPHQAGRFFLYRLTDGSFLALYQKCTHLGCRVPWDAAQDQFYCPCHGSGFNKEGEVLVGPAPRPLDIFRVTIKNGEVYVDTGKLITRTRFDPSQTTRA
jgi:cytochrome b6-f complex iron-sulfur subunit